MKQTLRWILALALLQASAVSIYWCVEHRRSSSHNVRWSTEPPQHMNRPLPSFTVTHRDGSLARLELPARRTILHVWATWCPPCRAELPALLKLSSHHDVSVVALALDSNWEDVTRFLGDTNSSDVVLATGHDVEQALDVQNLPVTFIVEANGHISLRLDGARDWRDEHVKRQYVMEPSGEAGKGGK